MLQEAKSLGIPAATRHLEVFNHLPVDLVIEATGHAAILDEFLRTRPPGVEVIGPGSLPFLRPLLRDLTESLEQQAATSGILRVMSGSPTDLQPVLDAVAENAARLCQADDAQIFRVDGSVLRLAASHGPISIVMFPQEGTSISRGWVTGRAVVDRQAIHIHDLAAESEAEFPLGRMHQRAGGHRTTLATPLLRQGMPIGAILIRRLEVLPFTDRQIELLKTFADQAVIAIENVRLFAELEARNRDLTETLEQQTATGEILRVISSSPTDVQPVVDTIAQSAAQLCEAKFCFVFRFDGELLHFTAHHGLTPEGIGAVRRAWPMAPSLGSAAGRSVLSRGVAHIPDVHADPGYVLGAVAEIAAYRSTVAVPMLRDGVPIGTINVSRTQPGLFPDRQVELLRTFADQAFKELEQRNRDLTETLEQQTATGEILRVISSSPTDAQPVFDTIAQSAGRLCEAQFSFVFRFDGELLHLVAHHGLGTVTNLAARLCGEAKAGQILVSPRVAGTVEAQIDLEQVGTLTLKGFLRPVEAFNVVGPKAGA